MSDATLRELVLDLVDDEDLFGPRGAVPASFEDGANHRVLLITGGNGSGKSFACKWLNANAIRERLEFMHVGMNMRTQGGIIRGFMFGDESSHSTGGISANVIATGQGTCRGRETPHVLCHDEPDIGMSDEMQDAAGQIIAGFCADLPALTRGVVVVTHSRAIASRLMALDPMRLRCGPGAASTADWLANPPRPMTPADLDAMHEAHRDQHRAIQGVINKRTAERNAARGGR